MQPPFILPHQLSRQALILILGLAAVIGRPSDVQAQTNYEPYTFLTFAGPPESPGWYDGTNSNARFSNPYGVATDPHGNAYVADTYNHTIRKISPGGLVTTLAGRAGQAGSTNGAGHEARFYLPMGVVTDTNGDVYVADTGNNTIRKITPDRVVTTLAGSPGQFNTNDGVGAAARFNSPAGLALDTNGNLFVADWYNHTIRKVTPAGAVTTLAGLGSAAGTNNGTGSAARFYFPFGLAVSTNSTLYVADSASHTIRRITSAGLVTTLAGAPLQIGTNNGTGGAARFNNPYGVTADTNGNVYVADTYNQTIRKITPAAVVTTVAGMPGSNGVADGMGSAARFNFPTSAALDPAGNVLVADYSSHTIRKVTPAAVVTTLAGQGGGPGTNNATGTAARFNLPRNVAVDGAGNVYVADASNHTIRKSTAAGAVTTLAGLGGVSGTSDGTGSAARFNSPYGVGVDTNGNVYVADTFSHTVRKITPAGAVTTLAGSPTLSGTNNGSGAAARFSSPTSVAVAGSGDLFVADTANHTVRKITPAGVVSTFAGFGGVSGTNNGTGSAARFNHPYGVSVDTNGNVYVADSYNSAIRKITPGGVVSTLAGSPGNPGYEDRTGTAARFYFPVGVTVDNAGNVLVTETFEGFSGFGFHTLRKVTLTGTVTTVAGFPGLVGGENGSGPAARFTSPGGVAVAPDGTLYVTDTSNHAIRKGYPAPPDVPVVDRPQDRPGVTRQLDVTNLTTTGWAWRLVRQPAGSASQLSSAASRNPTFTPDLTELYAVRFEGTNSSGHAAIGFLELSASGAMEPRIRSIRVMGGNVVLAGNGGAPGANYSVLAATNPAVPVGAWGVLAGHTFDNHGAFNFTNGVIGNMRYFRLRVP